MSNQFTTQITLQCRILRAISIGTLSVWMMMVIPWLTRTGQLWYLFQEPDRWTKLKQVRCQLGHKVTGRSGKTCEILSLDAAITNPSRRVLTGRCVRHCLQRDNLDEIEMSVLHSGRERGNTALNTSHEPNSESVPIVTDVHNSNTQRMSESCIEGSPSGTTEKFFHAR